MRRREQRELDRRLREARPAQTLRPDPDAAAVSAALARILGEAPAPSVRREPRIRSPRFRPVTLAIASLASVLGLALGALLAVAPAGDLPSAAGLPFPLRIVPADGDAVALLNQYADVRGAEDETFSRVVTENWWASFSVDGAEPTQVAPVESVVTQIGDCELRTVQRAGLPFDGQLPAEDGYEPGQIVRDSVDPCLPAIPDDPKRIPAFFARETALAEGSSSELYLNNGISGFLANPPISRAQEASVLRFVATLPDIRFLGTTRDRLGRESSVFQGDPDPNTRYQPYILVSPHTGEILAIESIYRGSSRADIDTGDVVSYTAWKERTP